MIRINLLPPEDRVRKREFNIPEMSTIYLVAAVVVFFVSVTIVGMIQSHRVRDLENKMKIATETR